MTASVLVVEDSETQALRLRGLLEAEGFSVACATSGEAALEHLNAHLPDLIVADFHLPGMDGRELSRQIRLNGRTRALPVLMLTGARESDLERQGLESGADAYVAKSADPKVVIVRLKALLRRAKAETAAPKASEPFRRARVLVAHPSATLRLRLRHLLEHDGYEVAALERLDPDCAALDGELDGVVVGVRGGDRDDLALLAALDARRARLGAPFQLLAFGGEEADRDLLTDALEAGADDVVPASANDEVVRARVRAQLRRKLMADEARRSAGEARAQELALARAEARAAVADDLASANRQLKDAQGQLVQAAKMASLGELVAGIAHEINNPLAFLLGHQDTVERLIATAADETPSPGLDKAKARLASMRVGMKRIQDLVLNLRKFSRLDEGDRHVLDAADSIETVLALLAHKLGDGIEVRRAYAARNTLEGSPALLNQVVMNIVGNAADALGGANGGRGVIGISTRDDGGDFVIAVEDSGPGVPADLRDRIFEPFFTTKPVGAGTGLGLAIAYNVVRAHGGAIAVDQGELGGARFTITIPPPVVDGDAR